MQVSLFTEFLFCTTPNGKVKGGGPECLSVPISLPSLSHRSLIEILQTLSSPSP